MRNKPVRIIGAGLAGCEAAYKLASRGYPVILQEMKPAKFSPAHHYPGFAELVCSNSFKANRFHSAAGLLKQEMRLLGSLLLECADGASVPAGGALAVDRQQFSDLVTNKIRSHPLITVISGEVTEIDLNAGEYIVIATGPLTSDALAKWIQQLCGEDYLSFYDAAAPIVTAESIDRTVAFPASRYGRGGTADYLNCPMDQEEYETFYEALITAESVKLKQFEKEFTIYEGCMPVEVLAKRGIDSLRYGSLKPVGLTDPRTGRRPWAVLQLRKENREGTLYNLVGFQTNLKFGEQKRVFSLIPGLENSEFVRYGVMHRNTFLNSPKLLDVWFRMRKHPNIFFAGQITGVEGYMESAASGLAVGLHISRELEEKEPLLFPRDSMLGALSRYVSDASTRDFQPMGSNMGLLPPLGYRVKDKLERYQAIAERSYEGYRTILKQYGEYDPSLDEIMIKGQ